VEQLQKVNLAGIVFSGTMATLADTAQLLAGGEASTHPTRLAPGQDLLAKLHGTLPQDARHQSSACW